MQAEPLFAEKLKISTFQKVLSRTSWNESRRSVSKHLKKENKRLAPELVPEQAFDSAGMGTSIFRFFLFKNAGAI